MEKLNMWGGLLFIGYLFGVIGVWFVIIVVNRFLKEGGKYGLVVVCVVGGLVSNCWL